MSENTVAMILAAGEKQISGVQMIKSEITKLRKAGISSVAVVTGHDGEAVEKELVRRKVISIRNYDYETSQMLDSVKLGIQAFKENYDKIMILPMDIPFVCEETLRRLIKNKALVTVPVHKGQNGHPIVIDKEVVSFITNYRGQGGLRGAIEKVGFETVEVEDPGVLLEADSGEAYEKALKDQEGQLMSVPMRAHVRVSLERRNTFLDLEVVEFLIAVDWLGSMNQACKEVKISYSKAWNMINEVESQLGYTVIGRKAGGTRGGSSHLTYEGRLLVEKYLQLRDEVEAVAEKAYRRIFS